MFKDLIAKFTYNNKLSPEDKKVLTVWFIVGAIIIIAVACISITVKIRNEDKNIDKEFVIVSDQARYFTVSGAITKFYSYMTYQEYEKLYNTLDPDYIKENKITKENISEKFNTDDVINYATRIMCQKREGNGITNYLVSGFEEKTHTGERLEDKYYLVVLDETQLHFSVKPISEKTFGGECK